MLKLVNKLTSGGKYSSNRWRYEDTYKYIFELKKNIIEAGFFVHYKDLDKNSCLKYVIELPTSYGCPVGCKFCASSEIDCNGVMSAEDILDIFFYIYRDNKLQKNDNIRVSYLGIGDLYYTIDNVLQSSKIISKNYNNIQYNVSSCLWNETMFEKISNSLIREKIERIQITYISCQKETLKKIIPTTICFNVSYREIVECVKKYNLSCCRINYVMIEDINTKMTDFMLFIDLFESIKDRIVVRISKLNETEASQKNKLMPTSVEKMQQFHTILQNNGYKSYLFYSYKNDNMNCGQLIGEYTLK